MLQTNEVYFHQLTHLFADVPIKKAVISKFSWNYQESTLNVLPSSSVKSITHFYLEDVLFHNHAE
jgi:hypothetical protein